MRVLLPLVALALAGRVEAQAIVSSPEPDRVSVTVYRDPDRGLQPLNLSWLGGYALVSETRHVRLPAGESELRFVGVTSGIVPQSAIVTGLGEAVIEKNRDARLLSPGTLLDATLGERLHLRRTSKATGAVREQDAIVRANNDGVVIQSADGVEALRCTGLPETLLADRVPADLSAKPTLSVRVRSPRAIERQVTLSYITNNFDWQADYVAELSNNGDSISLFGWLTMANGDSTGLENARTQAVAGKLNRQRVWVDPGQAKPISIQCWPQGTTSDLPEESEFIAVTGSRMIAPRAPPPPPPPPPPAAAPERGGGDVMAQEEQLGDVRLYRIPIEVTVAAKSQKQIALLRQPAVKVESILRLRPHQSGSPQVERVLVTRNRVAEGLGLALPAGKVALFGRTDGRRILLGEGRIDDYTVGEKVEIPVTTSTGVLADLRQVGLGESYHLELKLTNDLPRSQLVEVEFPLGARSMTGPKLAARDGWKLWRAIVPANGIAELHYTIGGD
ncbi:DUF4139 domain-containing protein [Sphingomonas hankyongi]|uniref:DUF4139 domain-containing protein n=1 Tax=Sphingomonas hankyongi TaxID=2908209 RepID=A0ABT0S5A4_9SPHN|nr:hypothetical protein [Sphingomonas hankyongi]MCL6730819.1 hypothetical protein [Sphingomonas hankyongi]